MLEVDRNDSRKIRGNLLGTLILHSGYLMTLSDTIHDEHSRAITDEEAKDLARLHEIICNLNNETRYSIEILREMKREIQERERRSHLCLVK